MARDQAQQYGSNPHLRFEVGLTEETSRECRLEVGSELGRSGVSSWNMSHIRSSLTSAGDEDTVCREESERGERRKGREREESKREGEKEREREGGEEERREGEREREKERERREGEKERENLTIRH